MDTDDLSTETYQAIIIEAEKYNHDLTLQFGLLASECEDEHEYIQSSLELIDYLRKGDKQFMFDVFFGDIPDTKTLNSVLDRISNNILKVQAIPLEKRHFDF